MQLEGPNAPSFFTAAGCPRIVLYANSFRDSRICLHFLPGVRVLASGFNKAFPSIRNLGERPQWYRFTGHKRF